MVPFSIQQVVDSRLYIMRLSLREKEGFCDKIFETQPNLLAHALALSEVVTSYERIEHVIHILMVLYHVFTSNGTKLRTITEEEIERAFRNNIAMLQLLGTESRAERERIIKLSTTAHPEQNALAFLTGYLNENGFSEYTEENNHCTIAAKNIFDCLVKAKYVRSKKRGSRSSV
jgi:hypothetical protein